MTQESTTPEQVKKHFGIADVRHGGDVIFETPVPALVCEGNGYIPPAPSAFETVWPDKPIPPQVLLDLVKDNPDLVRKFDTGATRSADAGRPDPEGFLSPLTIERYCQYMNANRLQPDGTIRDSDNWQKGIPLVTYMKGLWRHMHHAWTRHRGYEVSDPKAAANIEDDLCAVIFNASGYLHELMVKHRNTARRNSQPPGTESEPPCKITVHD